MEKVLLGMSGGVDSSVSAVLLKQQGYDVIGCTMRLWEEDQSCQSTAVEDAKKVCDKLNIKHVVLDYKKEFKCNVIKKFISEYEDLKTPNPCVECNKYMKFGQFYEKAKELECKYIATGHYARKEFSEKYNQYVLKKSNEEKKDQTYFLYTIPSENIEYILFPLQDYTNKEDTRNIAKKEGLEIAQKKDSQEICFIPDNDYKRFLKQYSKNIKTNASYKKGDIVLSNGSKVGTHNGLVNYTIGQRKGIGVSYKYPLYVIGFNKDKNQLIVGGEKELYSDNLIANEVNWMIKGIEEKIKDNQQIECLAKIRYRAKEAKATISKIDDYIIVKFKESQRAITPGQAIVFYDEDKVVLGGGKIIK